MKADIADTILYNGIIHSLDEENRTYGAMAIKDGIITAFSPKGYPADWRGFRTELFDMKGQTLLPGFIDCNVHAIYTSLAPYCITIDAADSACKEDFLHHLSEAVSLYSPEELIWCVGYESASDEPLLNRWELDRVSSTHPLIVSRTEFHATVVNTTAYNLLGIPPSINGVERDERGMPTGLLRGQASGYARKKIHETFIDRATREKALGKTVKQAAACGITTLNAMEGGSFFCDEDMDIVSQRSSGQEVELLLFPQVTDVSRAKALSQSRIGGNLYIDGTLGSKTAALCHSYENEPNNHGLLYHKKEEIIRFLMEAQENRLQTALSCIGEGAIELVLDAFTVLAQLHDIKSCRHRLELCVLPTEEQIERAVKLGLIFSLRPYYDHLWGGKNGSYAQHIGDRWQRTNPIGAIIRRGGLVCGGSESPVTPMSPLLGIMSAVNHHHPDHRTSVLDALKMYTINAAFANFLEHRIGSLLVGKEADLVLLDRDPMREPASEIGTIQVVKTFKKGAVIFG